MNNVSIPMTIFRLTVLEEKKDKMCEVDTYMRMDVLHLIRID